MPKGSLSAAIATATCGLLGSLPTTAVAAAEVAPTLAKPWVVDSALLYYGESDDRVKDLSLKSIIRRMFDEDRSLSVNFSVDSLTGASPTGAVPTDSVQTFTRPSGTGTYQTAAGALPLDDTFKDTRYALSGNWLQSIGEVSRIDIGVSASTEYDYLHVGANARYERDFNQRNTTAFAGVAFGSESIDPEGGTPVPFAPMQAQGNSASKQGSDSKTVIDGLIGVTQILSRRALVSLTYSYSVQDGYLNDPFKVVSVIDPVTGRPVAGPAPGLGRHLYENRPDSRAKHSVFTEWRYAFDRDSVALSYRLMTDDWGVTSNTLEGQYHWNVSARRYIEPRVRFYQQSAADFYRSYLVNGQPLPEFASADYRLAEMSAITAGFKYGQRTQHGEFSVRLEYYKQTTKTDDPKIGVLASYDLAPPLTAVVAQIGYKFSF
ncbi:MAG TPA: DUF3570 domain-containing protein [Steroidobacteraceae bacterium]|nr:DUF3570 domain-containing protein [Steroidobacteraceae bacterium]